MTKHPIKKFKGAVVKQLREKQQLKQDYLVYQLGISSSNSKLSRIENDKSIPTIPELLKIVDLLGSEIGMFVE